MFIKGEIIVCIIDSRADGYLTIGKDYTVIGIDSYGVSIINDENYESDYNENRFIRKSEYRSLIATQILE